jgi:hypothetical protein
MALAPRRLVHKPRLACGSRARVSRCAAALTAAALAACIFAVATPFPAALAQVPGGGVPKPVQEAIRSAPEPGPEEVVTGAYINDIQQLDFKANNYVIDLYVWFRWTSPDIDPSNSMEFMNRFASDDNLREALTEEPDKLPGGGYYSILRYQGLFSTKFQLANFPFDTQYLTVIMEDTVAGAGDQVYVPDGETPVLIDPVITLPGFHVGAPTMKITTNTYPTNFGDPTVPDAETYSRIVLSVPVTRPMIAMSIKAFVPIALIVVCALLVYFVRPIYVEGRIGLGITALLTLVAIQLTATSSLPDVDYLMMIDKLFLLAYLFIIVALARVVSTSWCDEARETVTRTQDRQWAVWALSIYLIASAAVIWTALR